jgi:hypothetical protein
VIDSNLLQALSLGSLSFPSNPREGCCTLKIKGDLKVDAQKPAGKNDPKLTTVGKEARHVSIELWWTTRIDDESRSFVKQISPVGLNAGKAWEISHPDCEIYGFDAILFTSIGELTREVGKVSITFDALSWKKTPPAQKGTGSKTATSAQAWQVSMSTVSGSLATANGQVSMSTISGSLATANGFDGPDAPKAVVP